MKVEVLLMLAMIYYEQGNDVVRRDGINFSGSKKLMEIIVIVGVTLALISLII